MFNILMCYASNEGVRRQLKVWMQLYRNLFFLSFLNRWSPNANGGVLESLGYNDGYRVDIDVPDNKWAEAPSFHDVVIFNTGHW